MEGKKNGTVPISIKKSFLLVSDRTADIRAEKDSLGALLFAWREVYFAMYCDFY